MARQRYSFDEARIARFLKEGRGQGQGADYKPWLTVRDVPSRGRSHRPLGMTTGRVHHLLSDIEFRSFLLFDWAQDVVDIREQFPLDRGATQRIAESMGVNHPCDVSTRTPLVMTTDFVIDGERNGRRILMARAVKPADELDKPSVVAKLEIERRYWQEQGALWAIITEREIPRVMADNIAWVHSYGTVDNANAFAVRSRHRPAPVDGDGDGIDACPAPDRHPGTHVSHGQAARSGVTNGSVRCPRPWPGARGRMIGLHVAQLFKRSAAGTLERVLWIDDLGRGLYAIDVESSSALPVFHRANVILEGLSDGTIEVVTEDPWLQPVSEEAIPLIQRARRDEAWALIKPLVMDQPAIFQENTRGRAVQRVIAECDATKPRLYRLLRRYWQRGCCPNALLPDFHRCGGRGKVKAAGQAKRGPA